VKNNISNSYRCTTVYYSRSDHIYASRDLFSTMRQYMGVCFVYAYLYYKYNTSFEYLYKYTDVLQGQVIFKIYESDNCRRCFQNHSRSNLWNYFRSCPVVSLFSINKQLLYQSSMWLLTLLEYTSIYVLDLYIALITYVRQLIFWMFTYIFRITQFIPIVSFICTFVLRTCLLGLV